MSDVEILDSLEKTRAKIDTMQTDLATVKTDLATVKTKIDEIEDALDSVGTDSLRVKGAPTYQGWSDPTPVAANTPWTVPAGKIYEVYAYLTAATNLLDLNDRTWVAQPVSDLSLQDLWFPAVFAFAVAFDSLDAPTRQTLFCTSPHGWKLSGGKGLKANADWVVLYRDITEHPW